MNFKIYKKGPLRYISNGHPNKLEALIFYVCEVVLISFYRSVWKILSTRPSKAKLKVIIYFQEVRSSDLRVPMMKPTMTRI